MRFPGVPVQIARVFDRRFAERYAIVRRSQLFAREWYVLRYPDVKRHSPGPLDHFLRFGLYERRDPGPQFSTAAYLVNAPEARESEAPFLHAMQNVTAEPSLWTPTRDEIFLNELLVSGLFDQDWYLKRYHDLARANVDRPVEHFISHGAAELRSPGPNFESETYADDFPEYKTTHRSPIEHYLFVGRANNYPPRGRPAYLRWLDLHDELSDADHAAIEADVVRDAIPPVHFLVYLDKAHLSWAADVLAAVEAQIGVVRCSIALLRGNCVDDAEWSSVTAQIAQRRTLAPVDSPTHVDKLLSSIEKGNLILLCEGSVFLRPHAAYVFSRTLNHSSSDFLYSDHDHIDGSVRSMPVFKPQMSPEYLRRTPYVGPLVAMRATGGTIARLAPHLERMMNEEKNSACDLLQNLDRVQVNRVPFLLYQLPVQNKGARLPSSKKENGQSNSRLAASERQPLVSIIIPTRDHLAFLRACIDSVLGKTDYPFSKIEILVVDNDTGDADTLRYFDELANRGAASIIKAPGPFNFSAINNKGVAASRGEILVFLNNDTTVRQSNWLSVLVKFAQQADVGVVGTKLLYPDDTIQHGGVVLGFEGVGGHKLVGIRHEDPDLVDFTREMTSVTGACCAIRRKVFDEVGGFDTALEVAFNDVRLCIDVYRSGYRNIYVAEPLLYHHELKSRGFDDTRLKIERNLRESNYVSTIYGNVFRDDPSYNPNLSVTKVMDDLALPPRVVRPWRRTSATPSILLLSSIHRRGYGVPAVLALQAQALLKAGFYVLVGGPEHSEDIDYEGCRRVSLLNERRAAEFAVSQGIDCILAHTPPFFNIARIVGKRPLCFAFDHGEPDPELFHDRSRREGLNGEKRRAAPFARRVFVISKAIYGQQFRPDAIVIRNGNSHLATWGDRWAAKRSQLRDLYGVSDKVMVLNVCRFMEGERAYKGVDTYAAIAQEFGHLFPQLKAQCEFAIAGRGTERDVAALRGEGLRVFSNVSDDEMRDLYAAADIYMNFSRWEGYNLGIGQALAMGLHVIASDIEAHREFPITRTNSLLVACQELAKFLDTRDHCVREPWLESWDGPLTRFVDIIKADLAGAEPPWL